MKNQKRVAKTLEYLNSEECIANCDTIPIYYMILFSRIFINAVNYARSLSGEVKKND